MRRELAESLIVLLGLSFVGCAPSPASIQEAIEQTQAAIEQTQAAEPTPTAIPSPTPIPLSDIDLEGILLIDGDLPTVFVGQQVRSQVPADFAGLPSPDQVAHQKFRAGEFFSSDGVAILLYESVSSLDEAYNNIVVMLYREEEATVKPSDVGEKSVVSERKLPTIPLSGGGFIPGATSAKLVFIRCHALIFIDLFSTEARADVVTTYAQRIDKRLEPIACR